ncbi:LTA synthase family protein [Inmirania thermothiophila]|uniref:Phosphoglycerol transferase MdoB-like AlkP superfamily enzyme n=1 Tax=Inmirania thermothiophila TaxID=1750597 RepID=A0A3N1Y7L7_9GAMM|nr:LTA synthase family protein [Inmirania thermothiophila]ROR34750.1 phosphoglycerol transferase MdoB-like AlkP superfamily enzyme [Inmirania thermothiophila]
MHPPQQGRVAATWTAADAESTTDARAGRLAPALAALRLALLLAALGLAGRILFLAAHAGTLGLGAGEVVRPLLVGLRFDLAVAGFLTLLAAWGGYLGQRLLGRDPRAVLAALGGAAAALVAGLQVGDLLYYGEAGRHLGYEIRDLARSLGDVLRTGWTRAPLWMLAAPLLAALPAWLAWRALRPRRPAPRGRGLWPELCLAAVTVAGVIAARGGLQPIPLMPLDARSAGDAAQATVALNGAFNALYYGIGGRHLRPVPVPFPDAEARRITAALYPPAGPHPATPVRPNIVVVLLESWSARFMSAYGYPAPTTPEFAALRARALTVPAMLAGGHRTTEGMFAVFCGAQNPLGQTVARTSYEHLPYRCLPHVLAGLGYRSAFFQGTHRNTSGVGSFALAVGFAESYGREELPPPRIPPNDWGLHDPDIYRAALEWMERAPRPFLVGINTNTTHDIRLPPGRAPRFGTASVQARYLDVLAYADEALGAFVRSLEARRAALGPTVLVLVADHTGGLPVDPFSRYHVPFALVAPGLVAPGTVRRPASQRDIPVTLLDLLGLPPVGLMSGKSLLRADEPPYFADYYHAGALGWWEGEGLVEVPLASAAPPRCLRLAGAPLRPRPAACGAEAGALRRRALAFTRFSQQALLQGRTEAFARLRGAAAP